MASVQSNYEINVAKKRKPDDEYGVHFCKIQLSSGIFQDEAEEKLKFFRKLFGKEYNVSMVYWKCSGECKEGWE